MWSKGLLRNKSRQHLAKLQHCASFKALYSTTPDLELVGHFSPEISNRNIYPAGQTFLHKIFGYRGIILHPWIASVYEKSKPSKGSRSHSKFHGTSLQVQTYYHVLMDMRDFPYNQSENAFVFTSLNIHDRNNLLDVIPGMDYVNHNHILPYQSSEKVPIHHALFEHFFDLDSSKKSFVVSDLFSMWQEENGTYLEVDKVYVTVVDQIKVVIIPFYLGFKEELVGQDEHWWRYTVCVENLRDDDVVISERHWKIISNGSVKKSRNVGEVGKTPVLGKDQPVYFNTSHISLKTESGTVRGLLKLTLSNGKRVDIKTPTFFLESRCNFQL